MGSFVPRSCLMRLLFHQQMIVLPKVFSHKCTRLNLLEVRLWVKIYLWHCWSQVDETVVCISTVYQLIVLRVPFSYWFYAYATSHTPLWLLAISKIVFYWFHNEKKVFHVAVSSVWKNNSASVIMLQLRTHLLISFTWKFLWFSYMVQFSCDIKIITW